MSTVIEVARTYLGISEVRGKKHNPKILEWFEESGHGWIKDDETAWCAAFVNGVLAEAGFKGTGSVAARSFANWGKSTKSPKPGDIAYFKRGSSSWQGHVAFFLRDLGSYVEVLGGNQSNRVSIARYRKSDLLGYRTADTLASSNVVKGSVMSLLGGAGYGGDGALDIVTAMSEADGRFSTGSILQTIIGVVVIGGALWALYSRWDAGGRPLPGFTPGWLRKFLVPETAA